MSKKFKPITTSTLKEVDLDIAKKFINLIKWDCPSDYECLGKYEMDCEGMDKQDCFKCWEQAITEYMCNKEVKDV